LRNLPRSLDETYKQVIERIESQGEYLHQLAKKAMCWLIHAKRILTITELRHAVAVEARTQKLDEEFIPDKEILASVCVGLVTIDTESDVVRLAHYTIQEYFEGDGKAWLGDAEADITTACVTYLSFRVFETGLCETEIALEERLQLHPLYEYAAENWGHHARACSSPEIHLILHFLNIDAKVSAASQVLMDSMGSSILGSTMPAIHLAAYFGLENIAKYLLENGHDTNAIDGSEATPLHWAMEKEHPGMVTLLLDYGAKVNARNHWDQTPLEHAIRTGNEGITKLLLENGAEVDAKDSDDWTPLLHAACEGYEIIVKLLLKNGARVDVKDSDGWTPLLRASTEGHKDIAKLLLENGAEVDAVNNSGRAPLSTASSIGHVDIVNLLLENGAEVDVKDSDGWTPLLRASFSGNEDIVKLLLENGADIDARDNIGWTSLIWALRGGHANIMELLRDKGADIAIATQYLMNFSDYDEHSSEDDDYSSEDDGNRPTTAGE
jgi:ankyrin repeat protein